jgi:alcohol oxidase
MVYTRAPASDFDDWGADGWESENLIPLMKKVVGFFFCIFVKAEILHLAQLETYEVQPGGPTHGDSGPIRVSYGSCQTGVWEEFIHVGTTYHKRPYADDTDDLETCDAYSVRY